MYFRAERYAEKSISPIGAQIATARTCVENLRSYTQQK
jgi:hypothetical protein